MEIEWKRDRPAGDKRAVVPKSVESAACQGRDYLGNVDDNLVPAVVVKVHDDWNVQVAREASRPNQNRPQQRAVIPIGANLRWFTINVDDNLLIAIAVQIAHDRLKLADPV